MDVFETLEAPLFQTHPSPMWICERETGLMLTANQAALTFYGYDEAEFLALNAFVMAPDCKIQEPAGPRQTRHLLSDGRWVAIKQECYELTAYQRPCICVIVHPLTTAKPDHELEFILKGCNASFIVLNERGQIERCSSEPMGLRTKDLIGRHYGEPLPHTLTRALKRAMLQLQQGAPEVCFDFSVDLDKSELNQWRAMLRPAPEVEGRLLLLLQETTELERARFEAAQLETRLRQAQKMETYGLLAGGIAHDFNNLLTIINMQLSLLKLESDLASTHRQGLEEIQQAIDRGANLTYQLLAMGRTQAMQPQSLSLPELLLRVMKLLRRVLGEDITLENHMKVSVPRIRADEDMLHQVLVNLAINARDAMPRGGTLSLYVEQATDEDLSRRPAHATAEAYVKLIVTDCGEGIPSENLPHVLEPFFTTKSQGKGTGLGLPTVYGIIIQHEGWLEIESEVGVGTKVRLFFPVHESLEVKETKRLRTMPRGTERIMVVEDDPALNQVASRVLTRCGYVVKTAQQADGALRLWEETGRGFDLLLTDLILPGGVSGVELAKRLRQEKPTLRVLITSGHSEEVIQKHFTGEYHFIRKPYMAYALAQIVRLCLDQDFSSR